jgi:5-methylcytosine-specific restriction endonuclease McrA
MIVPDAVQAAVRLWIRDETNVRNDHKWVCQNLELYLNRAGFRIAPMEATRQVRLHRARKIGKHSNSEWMALVQWAGSTCLCCGKSYGPNEPQKDHVVPLEQFGDDSIENIQPLCGSCNSKKSNKTIDYRHPSWRETVLGELVS